MQRVCVRRENVSLVGKRGDRGVERELCRGGEVVLLGKLLHFALSEELYPLPAIGAGEVAHVFHEAQNGNFHHLCHVEGFPDDHLDELLRGHHDDRAADGNALEDGQRHIARSRGHVDEHDVDIVPDDVRPELKTCARNERSAPDDGVVIMIEQGVHGDELDPPLRRDGTNVSVRARGAVGDAEHLGDRGARDVRVDDGGAISSRCRPCRKQRGDEGFSDSPLSARDRNDALDVRAPMRGFDERILFAGAAIAAASGTIMRTIRHNIPPEKCFFVFEENLPTEYFLRGN